MHERQGCAHAHAAAQLHQNIKYIVGSHGEAAGLATRPELWAVRAALPWRFGSVVGVTSKGRMPLLDCCCGHSMTWGSAQPLILEN